MSGARIGSYTDDTEQAYAVALWLMSGSLDLHNLERILRSVYSGEDRGYGSSQRSSVGSPHYHPSAIAGSVTVVLLAFQLKAGKDLAAISAHYSVALMPHRT